MIFEEFCLAVHGPLRFRIVWSSQQRTGVSMHKIDPSDRFTKIEELPSSPNRQIIGYFFIHP